MILQSPRLDNDDECLVLEFTNITVNGYSPVCCADTFNIRRATIIGGEDRHSSCVKRLLYVSPATVMIISYFNLAPHA